MNIHHLHYIVKYKVFWGECICAKLEEAARQSTIKSIYMTETAKKLKLYTLQKHLGYFNHILLSQLHQSDQGTYTKCFLEGSLRSFFIH